MRKNQTRIVIRVDSSFLIGSGHLKRCLTLANALRQHGANVFFVSREHEGNLIECLERQSYIVYKLPAIPENPLLQGYEKWLGVTQEQDVRDTLEVLKGQRYDWVVVDHYALSSIWQEGVRVCTDRVMVIDDLADRYHACDLLLDQNYFGAITERRYDGLVPSSAQVFLGPKFALLSPEYVQLRQTMPDRDVYVQRVLVYLGHANLGNQTYIVLEALSSPELAHLVIDVVTGVKGEALDELEYLARSRGRVTLHAPSTTLAGLIAKADLMISAGGATTWERMCLSCPAVVVSLAENQRGFTEALQQDGYQVVVPSGLDTSSSDWQRTILSVIYERQLLEKISNRSKELVDGFGVDRVVRAMDLGQCFSPIISCEEKSLGNFKLIGTDQYGLPVGEVCIELDEVSSVASMRAMLAPEQFAGASSTRLNLFIDRTLDFCKKNNLCDSFFKKLKNSEKKLPVKSLRVNILSDRGTWLNAALYDLQRQLLNEHFLINWVHDSRELLAGDICFILSYSRILSAEALGLNAHNLVVHASALPAGRGWSPMTWQILEGKQEIPLTLFEAKEAVDTGVIYQQSVLHLDGSELVDEWRDIQAKELVGLCLDWARKYPDVLASAREQEGKVSYYTKRKPSDSEIDPTRSIEDQFNVLRTVDNDNYPAYFYLRDSKYVISIKKDL